MKTNSFIAERIFLYSLDPSNEICPILKTHVSNIFAHYSYNPFFIGRIHTQTYVPHITTSTGMGPWRRRRKTLKTFTNRSISVMSRYGSRSCQNQKPSQGRQLFRRKRSLSRWPTQLDDHQTLGRSRLRDGDAVYICIHQKLCYSSYKIKQREQVGSRFHQMQEQDGEAT